MPDVSALAISSASLLVSGWIAYRSQLRRADMRITLLEPSTGWDVAQVRYAHPRGFLRVSYWSEARAILLSGGCPATISNDGARGGAIWRVKARQSGLGAAWTLEEDILADQPHAVAARVCNSWEPLFQLSCRLEDLAAGLDSLAQAKDVELRIDYHRLGLRGRIKTRSTAVQIPGRVLLDAIKVGAARSGIDLAQMQLLPWSRERLREVVGKLGASDTDMEFLVQWLWQEDVTYSVEGDDPNARLLRDPGMVGQPVTADGHRATLARIVDEHRRLSEEARSRAAELRGQMQA